MYVVYILQSQITSRYYIGHTQNLKERLKRHNNGLVKSTKVVYHGMFIHIEKFHTKQDAYKRELQMKSYKGGNAFKSLIEK
jgi:putative endonuclease